MQALLVPISVGELIDKITILRIKQQKADDAQKLANIENELKQLENVWRQSDYSAIDISELIQQLTEVNETLWNIEDDIRAKEAANVFDEQFIRLARSVYQTCELHLRKKSIVKPALIL